MIYDPIVPLDEVWVPLEVLDVRPGVYEISNYGNVRRIEDKYPIKQFILRNKYGVYRIVNLVADRSCTKPKKYLVHRLVGFVFKGDQFSPGLEINHINNNGMDNCSLNVEWCTPSYNTNYQKQTSNVFGDNLHIYEIYTLIEGGYSNEDISEMTSEPVEYIEYIRGSYIRNNPPSEFDEKNRCENGTRFPNSVTRTVCELFQSGMTYNDYIEIAKIINVDLPDQKAKHTFRAYCRNLYNRVHHKHISCDYSW